MGSRWELAVASIMHSSILITPHTFPSCIPVTHSHLPSHTGMRTITSTDSSPRHLWAHRRLVAPPPCALPPCAGVAWQPG
eukprot:364818-Chlamydomonas_euryale.AAC.1